MKPDWTEIIKSLNTSHIYKVKKIVSDKKGITGLEVYANGIMAERRMEIIRETIEDGFNITHFPNEDYIIVEPKRK